MIGVRGEIVVGRPPAQMTVYVDTSTILRKPKPFGNLKLLLDLGLT
jgi:hypothetical protein